MSFCFRFCYLCVLSPLKSYSRAAD